MSAFAALQQRIIKVATGRLTDVMVARASGDEFAASFDAADVDAFDGVARVGDFVISYAYDAAPDLCAGEELTINSVRYRVVGEPRRLSALDAAAQISEVA